MQKYTRKHGTPWNELKLAETTWNELKLPKPLTFTMKQHKIIHYFLKLRCNQPEIIISHIAKNTMFHAVC